MNTPRTLHVRRLAAVAALASALAVAGCGGGSDGPSVTAAPGVELVPGTAVPVSATSSVAGVIAFLMQLIAGTSETSDPIAVGDAVLRTSDTEDATPIQ